MDTGKRIPHVSHDDGNSIAPFPNLVTANVVDLAHSFDSRNTGKVDEGENGPVW